MGIAIITGASSGMGREFALQLEKSGEVDGFLLVARREERLRALATELTNATVLAADLGSDEGLQKLFAYLEKEKPAVKYLINAAGFGKFGDYASLPEADVAAMIDVNVKATVLVTHRVLPYM
ncbi:MAG: SDR family NAD(P)-dependent oxidoreductase, partial [Clostridia bacterium]|nr:SDR family NAD(P)-dependent oxidoreductase [Clostridia bacterium]